MKTTITLLSFITACSFLTKTNAQSVCTFAGGECCGEGITNFQLNGTPAINRTSTVNENAGFTNTGITTTVAKGQTYNMSITFPLENNIVNCNTYNVKIYVDYNQNGLLTDAGEDAVSLSNVLTGTHTASFMIPTSALTGNAYMRVMMKMAQTSLTSPPGNCGHSLLTPCNVPADPIGFHGEVENYTLNITGGNGISENVFSSVATTIFPNPFSTNTAISYTLTSPSLVSLEVYNILGEKVTTLINSEMQSAGDHEYNLDNENNSLEEGIYFVKFSVGDKTGTQKLIKIKH